MRELPKSSARELATLLGLFGLLLFASPLTGWWAGWHLPWYSAYLAWALLILMTALLAHSGDHER